MRALFSRHEKLVEEMLERGYQHNSPLSESSTVGKEVQDEFLVSIEEQKEVLRLKKCGCEV